MRVANSGHPRADDEPHRRWARAMLTGVVASLALLVAGPVGGLLGLAAILLPAVRGRAAGLRGSR